jgi:hypothetical protein
MTAPWLTAEVGGRMSASFRIELVPDPRPEYVRREADRIIAAGGGQIGDGDVLREVVRRLAPNGDLGAEDGWRTDVLITRCGKDIGAGLYSLACALTERIEVRPPSPTQEGQT